MIHTIDPRGHKVGGIETHVRLLLAHAPEDVSVLLVGTDEIGDCEPGVLRRIEVGGREIDFLPVLRVAPHEVNVQARRLLRSVTLRFALAALRHRRAIRRAVGSGPATLDLHRYEFAALARLLGLPFVQMVHDDGSATTKSDSLIGRYRGLQRLNQRHALRRAGHVLCVNDGLVQSLSRDIRGIGGKLILMSASVDTGRYRPTPFAGRDGVFRVVYAGRLDAVKDPGLMFETVRQLRARLGDAFEFHYVGAADPTRHPEFAAIADFTHRHGQRDAAGVGSILAHCHAGILTSLYEGMPCFLLEGLATGRPFGVVDLSCYDGVVRPEDGSRRVARADTRAASAAALADAFVGIRDDIREGRTDPARVAEAIQARSVDHQLGRIYGLHRDLVGRQHPPPPGRDPVSLGPLRIERLTPADVVDRVEQAVAGGSALRIAFCNAHSMLMAFDDPDYARALAGMTLLNDGIGATIAARLVAGRGFPANLNGTDLVPHLLGRVRTPLRIFLLGARAPVVAEAARRLAARHPGHEVVGARDGYFAAAAIPAVLAEIRAARPDLLLVAMGNPRQDLFVARHADEIGCAVAMGVGALFDFLAGAVPRAPHIVRRLRCEWMFRLAMEPRRLGSRYTVGIARFLWSVARLRGSAIPSPAPLASAAGDVQGPRRAP